MLYYNDKFTGCGGTVSTRSPAQRRASQRLGVNWMQLSAGQKKALLALIAVGLVIFTFWGSGRDPYEAPRSQEPKIEIKPDYEREIFIERMKSLKADGVILRVTKGLSDKEVRITVAKDWHILEFEVRLKLAQDLWKMWSKILPPHSRDQARITLVDETETKVGGSRLLGPSRIWVRDE